jgi:hypothetical protein
MSWRIIDSATPLPREILLESKYSPLIAIRSARIIRQDLGDQEARDEDKADHRDHCAGVSMLSAGAAETFATPLIVEQGHADCRCLGRGSQSLSKQGQRSTGSVIARATSPVSDVC